MRRKNHSGAAKHRKSTIQKQEIHRPDVPKHTIQMLHTKKLKKRGKKAEKYFQNNFQSTHVYNTDILVQLAFIKNPRYN